MSLYISPERNRKLQEILEWKRRTCSEDSELKGFEGEDFEKAKEWFLGAPAGLLASTTTSMIEGLLMSLYTLPTEKIAQGMVDNPDFATIVTRCVKSMLAYELLLRADEEANGTAPKVPTDTLLDESMKIFTTIGGAIAKPTDDGGGLEFVELPLDPPADPPKCDCPICQSHKND